MKEDGKGIKSKGLLIAVITMGVVIIGLTVALILAIGKANRLKKERAESNNQTQQNGKN